MFESLSERLGDALRRLSGRGKITEDNVREAMEDVRTALLEADVHVEVVRHFCDEVVQEAIGTEVTKSLKPAQEIIGLVHQKLVHLMGPVDPNIIQVSPGPAVVLLCGLQGSGKTTTAGKLAARLREQGRSVLVAACDLQRPAAVEQLRIVVEQVAAEAKGGARVAFFGEPERCAEYGKAVGVAVGVAQRAYRAAREGRFDTLIVDTAGRLHVDESLMKELEGVRRATEAHQTLLVVDSMAGQDALIAAKSFHDRLHVDGIILSKFDSDSRGGAALSAKYVTGAPILFVGVGERFDALEPFHPERIAGRMLGMGDVVSLVEKAQKEVDEDESQRLAERMSKGQFTMDDFLSQLKSLRRMGPMKQILGMLPGVGSMIKDVNVDDGQLDRLEGIARSMTPAERQDVKRVDQQKSRARRIAAGSGSTQQEVGKLVKQFEVMQKMTSQLAGLGAMGKMKAMKEMSAGGPGAAPSLAGLMGRKSTHTESIKSKFKARKKR
ncbi:MAG: signal recognition particle protein [Planctomycetes bacterium]|nr:signal recognition particle protein [Planctomycetota bacterium]